MVEYDVASGSGVETASSGTAESWRPSDLVLPGTRSSPLSPTILVAWGVSGEEYPAGTGDGCVLLYVRGAGVAAGDGDGDVVEAASSMEEGDDSGVGEHAEGGVPDSGDAAEDDGGGGVPAAVVGCEAATGDVVPAVAGCGEAATGDGVPAEAGGGDEGATAGGVPAAAGIIPVGPSGGGT